MMLSEMHHMEELDLYMIIIHLDDMVLSTFLELNFFVYGSSFDRSLLTISQFL